MDVATELRGPEVCLEPMRIGEILDKSFSVSKIVLKPLLILLLVLPVLNVLGALSQTLMKQGALPLLSWGFVSWIIFTVLSVVAGYYYYLSVVYTAAPVWCSGKLEKETALRKVTLSLMFRAFILAIWVMLLSVLFGFVLSLPFLLAAFFLVKSGASVFIGIGVLVSVGGIIVFWFKRSLSIYTLLLEKSGISQSIKKSSRLMGHRPNQSFYSPTTPMMRFSGLLLVVSIVSFVPGLVLQAGYGTGSVSMFLQAPVVYFSALFTMIASTFSHIAVLGFYYDLRARFEGFGYIETDLTFEK